MGEVIVVKIRIRTDFVVDWLSFREHRKHLGLFCGLQEGDCIFPLDRPGRNNRFNCTFVGGLLFFGVIFGARLVFFAFLSALNHAERAFVVPSEVGMEEALRIDGSLDLLKAIHIKLNGMRMYLPNEAFNFPVAEPRREHLPFEQIDIENTNDLAVCIPADNILVIGILHRFNRTLRSAQVFARKATTVPSEHVSLIISKF